MAKNKLSLEVNQGFVFDKIDQRDGVATDPNVTHLPNGITIIAYPHGGEDNWAFRVMVSATQAIIGFPKFSTIGIGFMLEEDGNTNLPYSCTTEKIFGHIACNKGDASILDTDVKRAIVMVQKAAKRWKQYEESTKMRQVCEKEPLMCEDGKVLSRKEFGERCHILTARRMDTLTRQGIFGQTDTHTKVRKHVVIFGYNEETRTWKYRLDLYCTKGKKEAIERAYATIVDYHLTKEICLKYDRVEQASMDYNRKIPISF